MHNLSIEVSNNAYEHLMCFLSNLKDDVSIIKDEEQTLEIDEVAENDSDYNYILDARVARVDGEATYSIDEVIKEYE